MENVQDSLVENAKDINGIEDAESIEDIKNIEDMEDIENMEDVGDIEDLEDIENIEDIDTFENFEDIDDIEVEETDDMGEMEGAKTLESGIQIEEPETESEEPKNEKMLSCNAITLPESSWQLPGYKGKKMLEGQYSSYWQKWKSVETQVKSYLKNLLWLCANI